MENNTNSILDDALRIGLSLNTKKITTSMVSGTIPAVMVPSEARIEDLERLLPCPARKRAAIKLHQEKSFIEYVNEHKSPDTRIFATITDSEAIFRGEIDYHAKGPKGVAAWREHHATLTLKHSPEWLIWSKQNQASLGQVNFATFIEENLADIVEPEAAHMLEIARDFKATRRATFSSDVDLTNNDVKFSYTQETTPQKTKRGNLEIPEMFTIQIPVFEGGDLIEIDAWFRYSINDGSLSLHYKLRRPDVIRRMAADTILKRIHAETKCGIFHGVSA